MGAKQHQRDREPEDLREVHIAEAVATTALGDGLETSWQRILAGETAIRPVTRFTTETYGSSSAAWIEGLERRGGGSLLWSLLERLLRNLSPVPPDALLITASTKGGIDCLERMQRGEDADIEDITLSSVPRRISRHLGLFHEGYNISASCASSSIAVAQAAGLIALGRADAVLVCCIDIVSDFTFSGFSALRALSPGHCKPFDRDRQGLSLGEGAAALLLMSRERAIQEKRRTAGTVLGWGVAGDAVHVTAPDKEGRGLIRAVSRALKTAGMAPEGIAAVSAHGTGTLYNDLMELSAFNRLFGGRGTPVYSAKGAIGHCLGAAGGVEIALGLYALSRRILPPTVGLEHPMGEAGGRVRCEPQPFSGDSLLTTHSGFGGINAALILGKGSRA